MGINFVYTPPPVIDIKSYLVFQGNLAKNQIDCSQAQRRDDDIVVARTAPFPLEIKIALLGPRVGQILVAAPNPGRELGLFIKEIEAIMKAFESSWPTQRHIISSDATLRDLYETTQEHAFLELWETRLNQQRSALNPFGRPVLGGGLRFVMPPQPNEAHPCQIEVKIESYLRDTKKIYVETQFSWVPTMPPEQTFDSKHRLNQVADYIEKNVLPFIGSEAT